MKLTRGPEFCPYGKLIQSFWCAHYSEFPILSELASKILNIPTSSSIIERTFSKISRYCTKERNRLKSATLAVFVQMDQVEEFQKNMEYVCKKNGQEYEKMSWNVIDDGSIAIIPDDLGGLLDNTEFSDCEA